ncbi:dihydroxyacetone kinase family protein [Okibacterium endophyticum]
MTRLFNDPAAFPAELVEGFAAAHPDLVLQVPGGVVRSTAYDSVAVVVGGGAGHYPTFCGLVGQGLAHGAAMGNIFSSPSAQQIYNVARAANRGHGVVFSFGNYAGDVLHFGEAADRLRADGIPVEIVLVTDDIASAAPDEAHKRRGIAGDLTVFKVAGAAADAGYSFDEVVRVAHLANERTRSIGVAFAGCTLPGGEEPLFTVPQGMMSLGLGIHGEPGIADQPVPSANGLAELLVERLLAEIPAGASDRIAVLLNGLGAVTYEELFVVYRRVRELLVQRGLTVVSPDVGELCTSLDMAGASLTLFWLDDELEPLWTSPSNTPAYRKGGAARVRSISDEERSTMLDAATAAKSEVAQGTPESRQLAARVVDALQLMSATMAEHAPELGRVDGIAGDGDHGIGMERGTSAALAAARTAAAQGAGAASVLRAAGDAWSDEAGGTSGALWGAALKSIGEQFGDSDAFSAAQMVSAVERARDRIMQLGKAQLGDKTMVDVLIPYAAALASEASAGSPSAATFIDAARVAHESADATAGLVPRLGRARPLAEKSVGTPDAGALSLALIIGALTDAFTTNQR